MQKFGVLKITRTFVRSIRHKTKKQNKMKTTKIIEGLYRVSNENESILISKHHSYWILQHTAKNGMFRTKKQAVIAAQNILINK